MTTKLQRAQTQQGHSKHFFEYIKAIGEAKSKQEEDKIVVKDVALLKTQMGEKGTDRKAMKEYVVRMFYAEMLGQGAEFGHIHGVNLCSSPDLLQKRTGYLATSLCVNPEHEFMYLVVATLQRDMKSASHLDIAAALTAACKLVRTELLTAINADVTNLLSHAQTMVRKRATIAMHAFFKKSDGAVGDNKHFRQALSDRDPAVMGASLPLFLDAALHDPASQRDLTPSFISILKQITEHRLAREYEYHRVPAPWMQLKILKVLAVVGADNEALSERCKEVLLETIKRADTGLSIGHAIIVECIQTITSIWPIPELLEVAAGFIAKFLVSPSANLRYLGIRALSRIVRIDPQYARTHQQTVIACLEDADDAIRRMTMTLLFAMCNADNVVPIVARLIKFLGSATDKFLRQDLVRNLCEVADEYSPGPQWYVNTLNQILQLAPEHVTQTTIQGMLKVIADGEGEDEAEDAAFRAECVERYFAQMDGTVRPSPTLVQVAAWVMGEYGFLSRSVSRATMIDRLCDMLERQRDAECKCWIVTALMKLVAFAPSVPENVSELIAKFRNSTSVSLQQRCYEFSALAENLPLMKRALPLDGCCEDVEPDESLAFLDGFIDEALAVGAKPYRKKEVNLGPDAGAALRTDAYKTQLSNVVDEADLDKARFDEAEPDKLVIKDAAKRWGRGNLEGEAGAQGTTEAPTLESDLPPIEDASTLQGGTSAHADPLADVVLVRRPTKNEKFMSDIFGGGGGGATKKGGVKRAAGRAKVALDMAAAAESAVRAETAAVAAPASAPRPAAAAAPPVPVPVAAPAPSAGAAASSSGALPVEFNFQKQLGPDAMLLRVGALNRGPVLTQAVTLIVTGPAGCEIDIQPIPGVAIEGGRVLLAGGMPSGQPFWMVARVRATGFMEPNSMAVTVTASTAAGARTQGAHAVLASDLMRPAQGLDTEAFGKQWVATGNEAKVPLAFPEGVTPDTLQRRIAERANLKLLQVIGREAIAAARLMPFGGIVLAHCTVTDGNNVTVAVRCQSAGQVQLVTEALRR